MKVVCVGNTNGDSKDLSASGDNKSLMNAELQAAKEKAFSEVQNACKRYVSEYATDTVWILLYLF